MSANSSRGQILAALLNDSLDAHRVGSFVGERERPIIWGVSPRGDFSDGLTVDGFIARAGQVLLESGCFYRYGNTIVQETNRPDDRRLTVVAVQHRADVNAASALANRFGVGVLAKEGAIQSLAAPKLVNAVLADETLWSQLRVIRYYARRPTFDADFNLCQRGWNAGSEILVHAPDVTPTFHPTSDAPGATAIDRLPPRLQGLLREFSWRSDADLVNALAMLLTGLLINHVVDDSHPGGIVDSNQSQTGKTLLVQCIGRVLDDAEPPRVSIVRDEELEKKLCAQLRSSVTSLFFLDNVRTRIESAVIEQNMLSPVLNFRILGRSATIERPNTFLWMITSNMTAGTPDLIRRCVPIRLFFEGDPKSRRFTGDPLSYASEHRLEIIGELAGLVLRWVERNKPPGQHKHRCKRWAATLGGILDANGLGEFFLANIDEAEAAMDQGLLDLATLAEHVVGKGPADLHASAGSDCGRKGRTSSQWVPVFAEAQVLRDTFAESNLKGKSTTVGIFLGGKVNRAVPIETADGQRMATLRRREANANQKSYYFEISATSVHDGQSPRPPTRFATIATPTPNGEEPASGAGDCGWAAFEVSPSCAGAETITAGGNGSPSGPDLEWV